MSNRESNPEPDDVGSTRALSSRAQQGGRADLEALYVRTLPALLAWIRVHAGAGHARRVDPGDLAQEVWLRVLEGFPRFDPASGSFRGWMFGIAKNVWLEQSNPRRRGNAQPLASDTSLGRVPDRVTSATRAYARDDSIGRFSQYVEKLDHQDRMIVIHHGFEAMPCADVGVRLGLTADAVSKRWQRLQAKMREQGVGRDLVFDE